MSILIYIKKFFSFLVEHLGFTIVTILVFLVIFISYILPDKISDRELRLCILLFLLLQAIGVFAMLRQYNATVQNTRLIIKWRESMIKFFTLSKQNTDAIENLTRKISSMITTIKKLDGKDNN